jgi:signal peptidase II
VRRTIVACASVFGIVLALDRFTKIFFQNVPKDFGAFSYVFSITQHQNFGLIGNLPLPFWVIVAVSSIILLVVLFILRRTIQSNELHKGLALTLIAAGAVGNLWDRLLWGYVFDWILLFQRSIINIADIAIVLGVIWYLMMVHNSHTVDNHRKH